MTAARASASRRARPAPRRRPGWRPCLLMTTTLGARWSRRTSSRARLLSTATRRPIVSHSSGVRRRDADDDDSAGSHGRNRPSSPSGISAVAVRPQRPSRQTCLFPWAGNVLSFRRGRVSTVRCRFAPSPLTTVAEGSSARPDGTKHRARGRDGPGMLQGGSGNGSHSHTATHV